MHLSTPSLLTPTPTAPLLIFFSLTDFCSFQKDGNYFNLEFPKFSSVEHWVRWNSDTQQELHWAAQGSTCSFPEVFLGGFKLLTLSAYVPGTNATSSSYIIPLNNYVVMIYFPDDTASKQWSQIKGQLFLFPNSCSCHFSLQMETSYHFLKGHQVLISHVSFS